MGLGAPASRLRKPARLYQHSPANRCCNPPCTIVGLEHTWTLPASGVEVQPKQPSSSPIHMMNLSLYSRDVSGVNTDKLSFLTAERTPTIGWGG